MQIVSRRKFLKLSGVAAAAAAASPLFTRSAFANPMGLPLGIQTYTVRDVLGKDVPGTLKALYDMGYRELEVAGTGGKSAAEFAQLAHDAGFTIPSAHVQLANLDELNKAFDQCHALGAHYATSSQLTLAGARPPAPAGTPPPQPGANGAPRPFAFPEEPMTLDHFQKLADKMNTIGRAAKAAGLQYAYHSHNHEFNKMPDGSFGYDVLLKNTDHDLVNFEIDCGWMMVGGGDPVHYLQSFPGRFKMLHVKDFKPVPHPIVDRSGPDRPVGIELTHGFIQYQRIFDAGKAAGIEHAFSEQEAPYTPDQMGAAAEDARAMKMFS